MSLDWTKANVIPRSGLEAWHQYEPGVSANGLCKDYSGNGRDLAQASSPPTLTPNVINGQPAWVFNGSSHNELVYSGAMSGRHFFMVGAYADATFNASAYCPFLLCPAGGQQILDGSPGATTFYDFSSSLGAYTYRLRDLPIPLATGTAPMSGQIGVMEVVLPTALSMNGIQIGYGAGNRWKGPWVEELTYSRVLNDNERLQIYQYFAMRYQLWQRTSGGLDVFPFVSNKARSSSFDQESFASVPYTGDPKVLVRGNFKGAYSLPFGTRRQEEYLAAEQFVKTHKSPTHSVYRDYRFYPARDREGTIVSGIREQGSDVSLRFNYSFDFAESDS